MNYTRPITDKILELMKEAFGSTFKAYYDGDPVYIPVQSLPCLIVDKQSTTDTGNSPTGMITLAHTIVIKAEFDKRSEFNKRPDQVYLKKTLEELAEGIDPNTNELGTQTIAGLLQRNFTLDRLSTGHTLEIDYGVIPRGDILTEGVNVTGVFIERRVISNRT